MDRQQESLTKGLFMNPVAGAIAGLSAGGLIAALLGWLVASEFGVGADCIQSFPDRCNWTVFGFDSGAFITGFAVVGGVVGYIIQARMDSKSK